MRSRTHRIFPVSRPRCSEGSPIIKYQRDIKKKQQHDDKRARRAVEKFIDRAFLAGAVRLRVVHGSGMGILRKALRQLLQSHPHVATVSEPPQNEGGAGATVVELRS